MFYGKGFICLSPPSKLKFTLEVPKAISSLKIAFLSLSIDLVLANSEDTDEMPHYATDLAGKLN